MPDPNLVSLSTALLACLEGCRLTAYQDSGGVWTIGIGHTGPDVQPGMTITVAQAHQLCAQDQSHLLQMVADKPLLVGVALVSFGYNCGSGTLAKVLAGQDQISNPKHTTDRHGNVLPGLVARRQLEMALIAASA